MKNYTTPRTLADCEFQTGYHSARVDELNAAAKPWERVVLWTGIAAFLIFGALALLKG